MNPQPWSLSPADQMWHSHTSLTFPLMSTVLSRTPPLELQDHPQLLICAQLFLSFLKSSSYLLQAASWGQAHMISNTYTRVLFTALILKEGESEGRGECCPWEKRKKKKFLNSTKVEKLTYMYFLKALLNFRFPKKILDQLPCFTFCFPLLLVAASCMLTRVRSKDNTLLVLPRIHPIQQSVKKDQYSNSI